MISDVLAFDIKVFSRNVPIDLIDDVAVAPSDTAFSGSNAGDRGAFVDVGFAGVPFDPSEPEFSTLPVRNVAPVAWQRFGDIWVDTFSTHYESNGIDDDLDGLIDQATDGLDNDSANGVDDNEERETMPPYPFRIQGVEVTFRIVERSTQQVRQTSVVHSFMPR